MDSVKGLNSKNVCMDMLERLKAQIPPAPIYGAPTESDVPRIPTLSDIEARIKEIEKSVKGGSSATPEKAEDRESAQKITKELQEVVDRFNVDLKSWLDRTDCVANFSWSYADGKRLEITSIDYMVYRKEPPSEKVLKDLLSRDPK